MSGREEHEAKLRLRTENLLYDMPQYVLEWNNNLIASNKSAITCNSYILTIRSFLKFIDSNMKNVKPDDLNPVFLDKYFISLRTKKDKNGNTTQTSDSQLTTSWFILKSFFEFMTNRGYISRNYVLDIACPKNRDLERINEHRILLNKEDFEKILLSVSKSRSKNKRRDMLIFVLFMSTGMRASALMEIDLKNIDLKNKKLYVIDKGEKRHEYVLSEKVIDVLNEYLKQREEVDPTYEKEPLFINIRGERISDSVAKNTVAKYTKLALGKKLSPHKLRSGFCSILYNEMHDIEFVRRAVGHSSSTTTQRYIVTNNVEKEKASQIMDSIF